MFHRHVHKHLSSNPRPHHQAREPPHVGCPLLFIQYIRSSSPYLELVFSIRNFTKRP